MANDPRSSLGLSDSISLATGPVLFTPSHINEQGLGKCCKKETV